MNWVKSRLRHLLGLTPAPAARKSMIVSARKRAALEFEQLEARNVLTTLLPAPAASVAAHPADNPAFPAGFDYFKPPVADLAIATGAPQLAALTSQAKPDDSL